MEYYQSEINGIKVSFGPDGEVICDGEPVDFSNLSDTKEFQVYSPDGKLPFPYSLGIVSGEIDVPHPLEGKEHLRPLIKERIRELQRKQGLPEDPIDLNLTDFS